jgi:hypothetical protein
MIFAVEDGFFFFLKKNKKKNFIIFFYAFNKFKNLDFFF